MIRIHLHHGVMLGAIVVTGCFNPTYNNPSCGPAGECPNGLVCSAGACVSSMTGGDGGGGSDATMIDTFVIDAPAACNQWTPHFFSPCLIGSPNGPVSLTTAGTYTYNTTTGTLVDPNSAMIAHATFMVNQIGSLAWGMNVTDFTVGASARLRVIGTKPLIIAAWGAIEIDGTIDVSSPSTLFPTPIPGAGSDPTLCGASAGAPGQDSTQLTGGSGGGGGGGFGGAGGQGGPGDNGGINQGGIGGQMTTTPHLVRGGCSGAASGKAGPIAEPPSNPNTIALPGEGGGAIQLTAQTTLTFKGTINAGGGGGQGAPPETSDGGGGGGAGGFVGLEAGTLVLQSGVIAANGGGGGGTAPLAQQGGNGLDAQATTSSAPGGTAMGGCGTPGGSGAAGVQHDGQSVSQVNSCGGGGGGGAAGFILLFSPQITTNATAQSPIGVTNPF